MPKLHTTVQIDCVFKTIRTVPDTYTVGSYINSNVTCHTHTPTGPGGVLLDYMHITHTRTCTVPTAVRVQHVLSISPTFLLLLAIHVHVHP